MCEFLLKKRRLEAIETRARAVGLDRAWVLCRQDVIAAAYEATQLQATLAVHDAANGLSRPMNAADTDQSVVGPDC